jgi:hypothetical protein
MDEEGFQRTMRYIFTFIEKVIASSYFHPSRILHPLTHTHRTKKN